MTAQPPHANSAAGTHFLRNALILGLLTAIGPFAIDMYLPSLPFIGDSLQADPDKVLMSLTAFCPGFRRSGRFCGYPRRQHGKSTTSRSTSG